MVGRNLDGLVRARSILETVSNGEAIENVLAKDLLGWNLENDISDEENDQDDGVLGRI